MGAEAGGEDGEDDAEGVDAMRAGCIGARPNAEGPAVHADDEAAGAKARGETAAAMEAGVDALEVWTVSARVLEKKEPTLIVPIGGGWMAAASRGRERRAASEAGR